MKPSDFIRILKKNFLLILFVPILLASIVIVLTKNPSFKYSSATTWYTGFTSTSSLEMNKTSNYYAVSTAFDNLISIIKSRQTQQEVAIRLFAQHLMLSNDNLPYLTNKSYTELNRMTPAYIKAMVVKDNELNNTDVYKLPQISWDSAEADNPSLPASIDPVAYELTVKNLKDYMLSSDTNFVYKLLNYEHPHYSIDAISSINVKRVEDSDLLQLKYETDDPGISQQTLNIYTEVCIKVYKRITENRSDEIIKYFEKQLDEAKANLKIAEDKLLSFNNENNIINYSEQSKAVAAAKDNLDAEYNNKKIKLAGVEAVISRLEQKMGGQQQNQLKNSDIMDKRNQLGDLNYQIALLETMGSSDPASVQKLAAMKKQADRLKSEIKVSVNELYSKGNSEGIPAATISKEWIDNVVEAENLKASIGVLSERMKEQQKEYSVYAPAGSNIKRIEREISVAEQRYVDILHSLNLAKLKMQDNELSSNIKTFDIAYFPLSPVPTKRKIMVAIAALMGLFFVLTYLFILEFFDKSLKNPSKASGIIKLPVIGVIPKILLLAKNNHLSIITDRLLDIVVQYVELYLNEKKATNPTKNLLFFSTLNTEGKSVVMFNVARKLGERGNKVLVLSYNHELLRSSKGTNRVATEGSEESSAIQTADNKGSGRNLFGRQNKRIEINNSFLQEPGSEESDLTVIRYIVNGKFYGVKSYQDILSQNEITINFVPDFVLIELPSIMNNPYPVGLLSNSDLAVLICRANRAWSDADQGALDRFKKFTDDKAYLVLNGVELSVIDSVLGDSSTKTD